MKFTPLPGALAVCAVFLLTVGRSAPPSPLREATPDDDFTLREEMVPMRDGVRLYTLIVTPKEPGKKLPILLQRTPYNASAQLAGKPHPSMQGALGPPYARAAGNYIWVFSGTVAAARNRKAISLSTDRQRGPLNPTSTR